MTNNLPVFGVKILGEICKDILYFPIWWYSTGLINIIKSLFNFLKYKEKGLALGVWIKNIFRPMYAQTDWQGILISILMRIVEIIARSIIMLFWVLVAIIALIIWIGFPFLALFELFFQII